MIGKNIFIYGRVQTISGPIDDIAYKYLLETMLMLSITKMASKTLLKSLKQLIHLSDNLKSCGNQATNGLDMILNWKACSVTYV